MAKVIFWNENENLNNSTDVAIAVATSISKNYKTRSILMQTNFQNRKIESSFTPYDELKSSGVFENRDIGIGALLKTIVSNKLTATVVTNYAKPVLKERLDVMYGVVSSEKEQHTLMLSNLPYIVKKADEVYDLVFIDLAKGTSNNDIKSVIDDGDVIVYVLDQDSIKLEDYLINIENNEYLKNKSKIIVLANYDDKSKYNVWNIKKRYRVKDPIFTLPYNFVYQDSLNDGNVIDFFYRNTNLDKGDYNGEFVNEVNNIVSKVIELSKIKDYQ